MSSSDAAPSSGPLALDSQPFHGDWQIPAVHDAMRRHRWATVLGMRAFIRHADVHALLKGGKHLREPGPDWMRASRITEGPIWDWWQDIMFANDGAKHHRLRGLVNKAFAAHSVEALRASVVGIADDLGDRFAERGEMDAVADFAHWMPVRTICRFLGIPEADVPIFSQWSMDLGKVFSLSISPETRRVLDQLIGDLSQYVRGVIAERRRAPKPDLVTALIEARDQGERLSETELVALVANIILGGHDTTRCGIACTIRNLIEHPQQWQKLCEDPSRAVAAAEESLRRDPSVIWLLRIVTEPFALDGVPFEPGEMLVISPFAANHDPDKFPDSARFDIGRMADDSMTFGLGPHFCVGAWIARMEIQESIRMLATRFPGLCGAESRIHWTSLLEFRSPQRLRVSVAGR